MHFTEYDTRVAAYAVIIDGDQILLSWYKGGRHNGPGWLLPGGGVELGEQLPAAVVREVKEETGYDVVVGRPLTTDTYVVPTDNGQRPYQAVRVVFEAHIVGGELGTLEVGGSTDCAAWRHLDDPAILSEEGPDIVGVGIGAWRRTHEAATAHPR